jgi:hypothetical protein
VDDEAVSTMQATIQGLPLREMCSAVRDYPQRKGGSMTQADQIAGYLKLTSAHFHSRAGFDSLCLIKRAEIADEMNATTLFLCLDIKNALGGWYSGEVL